jgi:hypothetical protein
MTEFDTYQGASTISLKTLDTHNSDNIRLGIVACISVVWRKPDVSISRGRRASQARNQQEQVDLMFSPKT